MHAIIRIVKVACLFLKKHNLISRSEKMACDNCAVQWKNRNIVVGSDNTYIGKLCFQKKQEVK